MDCGGMGNVGVMDQGGNIPRRQLASAAKAACTLGRSPIRR